jgi:hypothetical protein
MSLPILQWNPINTEYGEIKSSIYIKPTLSLLEFANRNVSNGNRTLMVQISGTGHPVYDGTSTLAILDKTSDVPECRQNFYNATGMYLMTLNVPWFGYPNKNGSVTVYEGILSGKEEKVAQPTEPSSPISKSPEPAEKSVVENYEKRNEADNTDYDDENEELPSKSCGARGMSVKELSVMGLVIFTLVVIIFFLGEKR